MSKPRYPSDDALVRQMEQLREDIDDGAIDEAAGDAEYGQLARELCRRKGIAWPARRGRKP